MQPNEPITDLLLEVSAGHRDAMDRLIPLIYDDLRAIAHRRLAAEASGGPLTTTALVHEAYLRLVDQARVQWRDRTHFFAAAAGTMRRILVEHARKELAAKRGGRRRRVRFEDDMLSFVPQLETLLAIDEAMTRLAALDERQCRVVEYRIFSGLTEEETAEVLGVSPRTVRRDWVKAKGWLHQELGGGAVD